MSHQSSNNLRKESGLSNEDVSQIKIFMSSYNDAIKCSQEIAQKDTSVDHYKNYLKVVLDARATKSIMIDSESQVIATTDLPASTTFSLMKFSQ